MLQDLLIPQFFTLFTLPSILILAIFLIIAQFSLLSSATALF